MKPEQLKYLSGYPEQMQTRVRLLFERDEVGPTLQKKYAARHDIRTDKALYHYVQALKQSALRLATPIDKVSFDSKLHVVRHALGTHTAISRVQGGKLKAKREIRIASMFKAVPLEFLRMIVVHELAHVRHSEHDKAFYQLCQYLEPAYHQFEFDLRLYLTYLDWSGTPLWQGAGVERSAAVEISA